MDFRIDSVEHIAVEDRELVELLTQVYVDGGFTSPDDAVTMFDPSAVRQRGLLIVAREIQQSTLAGMVIVVPPESPARRLAISNEAEMHLLAVKPAFRRQGLGQKLVKAAIEKAKHSGYSKVILWTQISMASAQKIYESSGFTHVDAMKKNGRDFKVYEMVLKP